MTSAAGDSEALAASWARQSQMLCPDLSRFPAPLRRARLHWRPQALSVPRCNWVSEWPMS